VFNSVARNWGSVNDPYAFRGVTTGRAGTFGPIVATPTAPGPTTPAKAAEVVLIPVQVAMDAIDAAANATGAGLSPNGVNDAIKRGADALSMQGVDMTDASAVVSQGQARNALVLTTNSIVRNDIDNRLITSEEHLTGVRAGTDILNEFVSNSLSMSAFDSAIPEASPATPATPTHNAPAANSTGPATLGKTQRPGALGSALQVSDLVSSTKPSVPSASTGPPPPEQGPRGPGEVIPPRLSDKIFGHIYENPEIFPLNFNQSSVTLPPDTISRLSNSFQTLASNSFSNPSAHPSDELTVSMEKLQETVANTAAKYTWTPEQQQSLREIYSEAKQLEMNSVYRLQQLTEWENNLRAFNYPEADYPNFSTIKALLQNEIDLARSRGQRGTRLDRALPQGHIPTAFAMAALGVNNDKVELAPQMMNNTGYYILRSDGNVVSGRRYLRANGSTVPTEEAANSNMEI